jgi:ribA/ribD-fused uncharacterized protein
VKVTEKYVFFWQEYLSNWANVSGGLDIKIKGKNVTVPTAEHIFMIFKAQYFKDDEAVQKIIECKTPKEAKAVGRSVRLFDAERWDKVSPYYMSKTVRLRYTQDKKFADMLTSKKYKDKTFVEASPYDKIWGIGMSENDPDVEDKSKWQGTNKLGKCLTQLRDKALAGSISEGTESLLASGVLIFHELWNSK